MPTGRSFYIDLGNTTGLASDSNDGMSRTTPWLTCSKANTHHTASSNGCMRLQYDAMYIKGVKPSTGPADQLKLQFVASDCLFDNWGDGVEAIIDGNTLLTSGWTAGDGSGGKPTGAYWQDIGTLDGIRESVANVCVNGVENADGYGRAIGDQTRATSAANCTATDSSWYYDPAVGGGRLYLRYQANTNPNGNNVRWSRGNQNGVETGTPTYTTYPTAGTFNDLVRRMTFRNIHSRNWRDPGTALDRSTFVSIGYCYRFSDSDHCLFENLGTATNPAGPGGYHVGGTLGSWSQGNVWRNCYFGGCNPDATNGATVYVSYCGNNVSTGFATAHIDGDRYENCVSYPYGLLDENGAFLFPTRGCDSFLTHTDSDAVSISSITTGSPTTVTTSTNHLLRTGLPVWISDFTGTPSINGLQTVASTPTGTTFTIAVNTTGGQTGTGKMARMDNCVRGILWKNCTTTRYGDNSGLLQLGSEFVNRSSPGTFTPSTVADLTTPTKYPAIAQNCTIVNGIKNLLAGPASVCFVGGKHHYDFMGLQGATISGTGANIGSTSGDNVVAFFGTELVVSLDNGNTRMACFQLHQDNRIVLVGTSMYVLGSSTDEGAADDRALFFMNSAVRKDVIVWGSVLAFQSTGGHTKYLIYGNPNASRTLLTGTVSAHTVANPTVCTCAGHNLKTGQWVLVDSSGCTPPLNGWQQVTVTDANTFTIGVNVTSIAGGSTFNWTRTANFNWRGNLYANYTQPMPFNGYSDSSQELNTETKWKSAYTDLGSAIGIDPTSTGAVYNGTTNPFTDPSGGSLGLTAAALANKLGTGLPRVPGCNLSNPSGAIGAYQYAPEITQEVPYLQG